MASLFIESNNEAARTASRKRTFPSAGAGTVAFLLITLAAILAGVASLVLPQWSLGESLRALTAAFPAGMYINRGLAVLSLVTLLWSVYRFWKRGLNPYGDELRSATTRSTDFWTSALGFQLLTILTIFLWRWSLMLHYEMNPDESQSIAAAVALLHDPRYWIAADVGTHGPLIAFSRLIPCLLGMVPDYASGRLVGTAVLTACVFASAGILRSCLAERTVRLVITPLTVFIASIKLEDIAAYNGEHFTVFLCVMAAYFGVRALRPDATLRSVLTMGLTLGCVPWAKIQGVPLAVTIGAIVFFALIFRKRGRRSVVLLLTSLVPSLAVLAYIFAARCSDYFWHQYILQNFAYSNRNTYFFRAGSVNLAVALNSLIQTSPFWQTTVLFCGVAGLFLYQGYYRHPAPRPREILTYSADHAWIKPSDLLLAAILALCAALYSTFRLGITAGHYLVFLIFPLGICSALIWAFALDGDIARQSGYLRRLRPGIAALSLLFPLLGYGYDFAFAGMEAQSFALDPPKHEKAIALIKTVLRPGEPMIIWGWAGMYYTHTGATQGVRNTNTSPAIAHADPMYAYFHQTFLEDFDRSHPVVFVDATGPGHFFWSGNRRARFENYGDVRARIEASYTHLADIEGTRIYVRNDRWKQVSSHKLSL